MANRYGSPRSKRVKIGISILTLLLSVALVAVFSFVTQSPKDKYYTSSFKVKSDNEVIIEFSFFGQTPALCVVRAMAQDMSIVGWKAVVVTAQRMKVGLRTVKPARYAEVKTCRRMNVK